MMTMTTSSTRVVSSSGFGGVAQKTRRRKKTCCCCCCCCCYHHHHHHRRRHHRASRRRRRARLILSSASAKDSGDFDDVPKGGGGGGGQKKSSSSKTEDALSSLEALLGIDAGSKKTTPKEEEVKEEEVKEEEKESPILFGMKTMTKPKYERAEGVTKYWSPFFSPLSAIYNVPTEEPTAAERLAVLHLIFFAADFVAVKTGANAEGGFFFSTFALFADAVKTQNEWWRLPSTALADFGLGHVVATNASLWLIGREIETLLGTMSFLAVYFLGAMGGAITALAFDDNSKVIAGSSGAVFALYGAILTYTVLNLESGWNQRGFTTRLFRIGASATALCYIASETASDGVTHVVNNWDHFGGFLSGIFLAYYGLCPLFSSIQFKPGEEKRRAQRLNLEDKTLQEPFGKTSAILYGVCANLVAASAVVAFKRMSGVDDF